MITVEHLGPAGSNRAIRPDAKIIILDDEPANVRLLQQLLGRAGYTACHGLTDPRELVARPEYLHPLPDLLLLDLHMPVVDGYTVLSLLRARIDPAEYHPVLVLTADISAEARQRALSLGASDFVTKPFDPIEVLLRIRNLLTTRMLHVELQQHNTGLEQRIKERTMELEMSRVELLDRLAIAAEFRDDVTHEHIVRVGNGAAHLARALGLSDDEVDLLRRVAPLHDIGKLGIPDRILLKPGRLTDEEFEIMRTHTTIGARILGGGQAREVRLAEQVARTHHERWDGDGYPDRLRGDEIPLASRIVSVVDVFDALLHERPYKPAWPLEEAIAELNRQRGRQFDPLVLDTFLALQERRPVMCLPPESLSLGDRAAG